MSIYESAEFTSGLSLVMNRIKVINQMLGYTVVGCLDNPVALRRDRGSYSVMISDCDFVSFGCGDLDGLGDAIVRLDALNDGFWLSFRAGLVRAA